jgi:hypothetical protein
MGKRAMSPMKATNEKGNDKNRAAGTTSGPGSDDG